MTNPSIASDLIERLVLRMVEIADRDDTTGLAADALREGSEALSQLTREVAAYRGALEEIADEGDAEINPKLLLEGCKEIAREALSRSSGRVSDATE